MTDAPLHLYSPSDRDAGIGSPCKHCGQPFGAHDDERAFVDWLASEPEKPLPYDIEVSG